MATSTTTDYNLHSGFQLYQRTWTPSAPPKVHLAFIHGFSDSIDHYDAFFKVLLASYPIRVVAWDRRGWGKSYHSNAERGDTGTKEQQLAELNEFLDHVVSTIPDLKATPLFLMGHSMGGQELAYYILNKTHFQNDVRPKVRGAIFESPYIGLDPATEPSPFKVWAGKVAAGFLPKFQLYNPVKVEFISPDKAVQKMYKEDPRCHGLGTLECFRDMLQREAELSALAKKTTPAPEGLTTKLPCPTLWTHGTGDKATDYNVSKLLCETLAACDSADGHKVFKSYEGWAHQLHNQPDGCKEQYAKDVGDWIMSVLGEKK